MRFGSPRKLEAFCEREYGRDVVESFHRCSSGLLVPVPIMGLAAAAYRGTIVPRKVPWLSGQVRRRWHRNFLGSERGGFASLSDLISEATTGGKQQNLLYNKTGIAPGATTGTSPLWNVGALPAAGGVGGASGTGSVPVNTTVGGLQQADPAGGDTLHLTTWTGMSTVAGSLLLYDRLWHMTYNHATATTTAVDANNRPARYQGAASAPGNFVTQEVTTALSATAHNLGITYVDADGNTAEANTDVAVRVSAAANTLAFTAPQWTHRLTSPDLGLRYLTELDQSTITSVTGISSAVIGHPLGILPQPAANIAFVLDGINSAFNLIAVLTDACLALMDFQKSANTAATVNGMVTVVSG